MRNLAIAAAALLLTACTADSAEPESAPARPACVRVETGSTAQARATGNKLWDDDWLTPKSVAQGGCADAPLGEGDGETDPQSLNTYVSKLVGERQGQ